MTNSLKASCKSKITLQVERDEASGWYLASWDASGGKGGVTTQGQDLQDLQANVQEAVRCHFEQGEMPRQTHLHLVADPVSQERGVRVRKN